MLSNNFDMNDLGVADVVLGVKITRTVDEISLSYSNYVKKIIERLKEYEIKGNTNPSLPHFHLCNNTWTGKWQLEYSQIIKSLMYLMNYTRPNLSYVVSKLRRYTSNPSDDYWTALLRIVGYLKNNKQYDLRYRKYPLVLE